MRYTILLVLMLISSIAVFSQNENAKKFKDRLVSNEKWEPELVKGQSLPSKENQAKYFIFKDSLSIPPQTRNLHKVFSDNIQECNYIVNFNPSNNKFYLTIFTKKESKNQGNKYMLLNDPRDDTLKLYIPAKSYQDLPVKLKLKPDTIR